MRFQIFAVSGKSINYTWERVRQAFMSAVSTANWVLERKAPHTDDRISDERTNTEWSNPRCAFVDKELAIILVDSPSEPNESSSSKVSARLH